MKRLFSYICISFLLNFFVCYAYAGEGLVFLAEASKSVYGWGEPIQIKLSWTNTSDKDIVLFVPDNIHKNWSSIWELQCKVKRPNGEVVILRPATFSDIIYTPEKRHFRKIAPSESMTLNVVITTKPAIPLNMLDHVSYLQPDKEGDWVALRDFPPKGEQWMTIADIRDMFNIRGGFYIAHQGIKEIIVMQDILRDVFNLLGEYNLTFIYKNMNKTTFGPDVRSSRWKRIVLDDAWTGELTANVSFSIQQ